MFNRIKEFLNSHPDSVTGKHFTSAYRFWQDTQLSRSTAYRLYNDASYIPTGDVLDKVCSTYKVKPGLILDWEPDDGPQATIAKHETLKELGQDKASDISSSSKEHKYPRSFLTVVPKVPESA